MLVTHANMVSDFHGAAAPSPTPARSLLHRTPRCTARLYPPKQGRTLSLFIIDNQITTCVLQNCSAAYILFLLPSFNDEIS